MKKITLFVFALVIAINFSSCGKINSYIPFDPQNEPVVSKDQFIPEPPDFLNEKQAEVYVKCYSIFKLFDGASDTIDRFPLSKKTKIPDGSVENPKDEIIYNGWKYIASYGRYQNWDDFVLMCKNVFTDEYFMKINSNDTFINRDGRLYYIDAIKGSEFGYSPQENPDEYELISQTDELVKFNVIAHYYINGESKELTTEKNSLP